MEESAKRFCVPIELKRPVLDKEWEGLPQKDLDGFPKFRCSRILIKLRLLLVIVGVLGIWLESLQTSNSTMKVLQLIFIILDFCLILPFYCDPPQMDVKEYKNWMIFYASLYVLRSFITLAFLALIVSQEKIAYVFWAASIGSILIEFVMWKQQKKCYNVTVQWSKIMEKEMLGELTDTFGKDNKLGEPYSNHFLPEPTVTHELVWPEDPLQVAEDCILPNYLFSQTSEGKTEYFVQWEEYRDVSDKLDKYQLGIPELIERNKKLRRDLWQQSALIVHLKWKLFGRGVDTSDAREFPGGHPRLKPWSPKTIDGLFVSFGGKMDGFINLTDFRALTKRFLTVKDIYDDHVMEKHELKKYLQQRKMLNNSLIGQVLKMRFPNESEDVYASINDVD